MATIHATCVVLGGAGVLLRGPSGAGKSTTAFLLLERAANAGRFAALVADDRVIVRAVHGRILASAPPPISGLLERRGLGILRLAVEQTAVVRLIVDLDSAAARLPDPADRTIGLHGVALPRLVLAPDPAAAAVIEAALGAGGIPQAHDGATDLC